MGGAVDEAREKELGVCRPSLGWKGHVGLTLLSSMLKTGRLQCRVKLGAQAMGVSLCSPTQGLSGRVTGQQTQRWAQPSSADPAAPGPERRSCSYLPGAEQSEGQGGKGSLCSLLLPPALCLWENWALARPVSLWGTLCVCFWEI